MKNSDDNIDNDYKEEITKSDNEYLDGFIHFEDVDKFHKRSLSKLTKDIVDQVNFSNSYKIKIDDFKDEK